MANDKPVAHRSDAVIIISFFIAIVLTMLTYPDSMRYMIPNWVLLVLFYWCLVAPDRVGVFTGWSVGLFVDILNFTVLGQHALTQALVALIAVSAARKILAYPLWQQCFIVLALSGLATGFQFWVYHLAYGNEFTLVYWQSAVMAALIWPLIRILLDRIWYRRSRRSA